MIERHDIFHETGLDEAFNRLSQLSTDEIFEHHNHLGSGADVHAMKASTRAGSRQVTSRAATFISKNGSYRSDTFYQ